MCWHTKKLESNYCMLFLMCVHVYHMQQNCSSFQNALQWAGAWSPATSKWMAVNATRQPGTGVRPTQAHLGLVGTACKRGNSTPGNPQYIRAKMEWWEEKNEIVERGESRERGIESWTRAMVEIGLSRERRSWELLKSEVTREEIVSGSNVSLSWQEHVSPRWCWNNGTTMVPGQFKIPFASTDGGNCNKLRGSLLNDVLRWSSPGLRRSVLQLFVL